MNIEEIVSQLTLKQQLLELIMLDIRYFGKTISGAYAPVTVLPQQIKDFLKQYPIGGITLFRENLTNPDEVFNLTNELQKNTLFGRFIGVDQEGGIVTRISGATDMPGNMALGAINEPEITTKAASIIGSELKELGINLNFAPCLDVNSNPLNPIIGIRSFGHDAELVATHGAAYIAGMNQQQIISCVKHFPGHGNVVSDTHVGETYVNSTAVEFEKCDLKPFVAAIKADVDMIMTAHIIAPRLDNSLLFSEKAQTKVCIPTTFSKAILTKMLRQQLGYKGIIISDALDMQAITQYFEPVEATILALSAGIDLILMPLHIWDSAGIQKFIDYFNLLAHKCNNSPELKQRISESCTRILKLKLKKTVNEIRPQEFCKIVGNSDYRQFEQEIASRAITLQKNSKKTLPWVSNTIAQVAADALKSINYTNITTQLTSENTVESITQEIALADKILVLTYNVSKTDEKLDYLMNRFNHFRKPYVMFSCRNPYDIMFIKDVTTNILVYGVSGLDQTNYQVRNFTLNLTQAVIKVMTATDIKLFNTHCPVSLEHPKKDPRGEW